jgi:hypothetical protein
MDLPDAFRFTLITNDPALASHADAAGVDIIGVDIERLNKSARQGHIPNARISDHELSDLKSLARVVHKASLFARLNPVHQGSKNEVESALANGASVLMLPYFFGAEEVEEFVRLVDGRASVVLLLETSAAVVRLHEVLGVGGIDEVMVGLNDLHLSMGVSNHFEPVASELMTMVSDQVRACGVRFGFGGLARAFDDRLPVPSDLVLAQHARLASSSAWISRSLLGNDPAAVDLTMEVARLRTRLAYWFAQPKNILDQQRDTLRRQLRKAIP